VKYTTETKWTRGLKGRIDSLFSPIPLSKEDLGDGTEFDPGNKAQKSESMELLRSSCPLNEKWVAQKE
jgi:hypothetical protein